MKKIAIILFTSIIVMSCNEKKELNIEDITNSFTEQVKKIQRIQYDVQNITQFSSGTVWDNTGFAILEREATDTIFGFSFYGIRDDVKSASIYKDGIGFDISNEDKTFEQEVGGLHFLGNPGGQMIYKDFFTLDSVYKSVAISETEDSYVLDYAFEDDVKNNITNKTKTIELSKDSFLPKKVTSSLQPDFGKKQVEEFVFKNIKINEKVEKNINAFVEELNVYEQIIEDEETQPNPLLKQALPKIALADLFDENTQITITSDKLTLIDFWEVWCGWCIKAFPDVQNIQNTYKDDVTVIGIVTQDLKNARKLVTQKKTTFLNLIGTKELNKTFGVNSWPRYFLVDKNGIIQEEYYGFSDKIEEDIKRLIGE
ncbi:MAG: TlpA disulfide reductase family protein [Bacteroidota bacterium]